MSLTTAEMTAGQPDPLLDGPPPSSSTQPPFTPSQSIPSRPPLSFIPRRFMNKPNDLDSDLLDDSMDVRFDQDDERDVDFDLDSDAETQSECGEMRTPERMDGSDSSSPPFLHSNAGAELTPPTTAEREILPEPPSKRQRIELDRTPSPPPCLPITDKCPSTPIVSKRTPLSASSPMLSASILNSIMDTSASTFTPPVQSPSRRRAGMSLTKSPKLAHFSMRTVRSPSPSPPSLRPSVPTLLKHDAPSTPPDPVRHDSLKVIIKTSVQPGKMGPPANRPVALRFGLSLYPTPTPTPSPGPAIHPSLHFRPDLTGVAMHGKAHRGQVLVRTSPQCAVLHSKLLGTHCSGCLRGPRHIAEERGVTEAKASRLFLKCSRCETVTFCSLKCYAKSASSHFAECRVYKRSGVASAEVRLITRFLWARRRGQAVELADKPLCPETAQSFLALTNICKQVCRALAETTDDRVPWTLYGLDGPHDLYALARKVLAYHFEVKDHACRPLGLCVSPVIGQFAHSCVPTAVLEFPFGTHIDEPMRIIANQELSADDEVTISYIDLGLPIHRRSRVLAIRGVNHICDACNGQNRDDRWSARHGCAQDGLVPLAGNGAEVDPDQSRCSMCSTTCWVDVNKTCFEEVMSRLGTSLESEVQGVMVKGEEADVFGTSAESSLAQEAATLDVELRTMLEYFPDTLYPLGHLRLRLGRLLMDISTPNSSRLLENYSTAIEALDTALGVMREWFSEDTYPILLSIGLSKIECHFRALDEVTRPLREYESRMERQNNSSPLSPNKSPKTMQQVENDLKYLAVRKCELRAAQTHYSQMLDAINEASADGGMMLEGVMIVKLTRYIGRSVKVGTWLKKLAATIKSEEGKLITLGGKKANKPELVNKNKYSSVGLGTAQKFETPLSWDMLLPPVSMRSSPQSPQSPQVKESPKCGSSGSPSSRRDAKGGTTVANAHSGDHTTDSPTRNDRGRSLYRFWKDGSERHENWGVAKSGYSAGEGSSGGKVFKVKRKKGNGACLQEKGKVGEWSGINVGDRDENAQEKSEELMDGARALIGLEIALAAEGGEK